MATNQTQASYRIWLPIYPFDERPHDTIDLPDEACVRIDLTQETCVIIDQTHEPREITDLTLEIDIDAYGGNEEAPIQQTVSEKRAGKPPMLCEKFERPDINGKLARRLFAVGEDQAALIRRMVFMARNTTVQQGGVR